MGQRLLIHMECPNLERSSEFLNNLINDIRIEENED